MDFRTWEPVYEAILVDMGYERESDEYARDVLRSLVGDARVVGPVDRSFEGDTVAIAAPGPDLEAELEIVRTADRTVAAGTAADRLLDADVAVDWVVTDLDGHATRVREFAASGAVVAVHAHGDNADLLSAHLPVDHLEGVLPTTQAAPAGPVANTGGFTDGDRAAFLADHLGAEQLLFPGWDFDDPSVGVEKRRKLEWAARLLLWLERRRGESFDVLEGRRCGIDDALLPD